MICIRRARPGDAAAIGAVHVESWRAAYAGVLPADYLARLSPLRQAASYDQSIADRRRSHAVFVAVDGADTATDAGRVIGFASGGRARRAGLAAGEVETLYVLDDFRDQGVGRRLLRAMTAHLTAVGCGSVLVWVLEANPARWFYQRLGGRAVAREEIRVGGEAVSQVAMRWDPIDVLLDATAPAREG